MIIILLLKQNESLFRTNGMKAESMTIILYRYVFHTLVFTVIYIYIQPCCRSI